MAGSLLSLMYRPRPTTKTAPDHVSAGQEPFLSGGRYWVRTSDLFGVNEARYHCANRPATENTNLLRVTVTNAVSQPALTRAAMIVDVVAKVGLVVLLVIAVAYPDLGNVRGKAAGLRAVAYPLGALVVPAIWWLRWRTRPFPWLGDALVTLPWFTDTLGNRLNLFDTIDWFDDWMHFMNWGLLTAGVLVLTLPDSTTFRATLERALSFGVTAALGWELAEYVAFIRTSPERDTAYTDTLGDLSMGTLGSVVAAAIIAALWRRGALRSLPHLPSGA
jgi:hypothetical protein